MARWLYTLPLRLRSLFRRDRVEDELSDEIQFHLEQLTQRHIDAGLTPDAARQAALGAMGGVEQRKEECRDARHVRVIEHAVSDVRYSLRLMRRSPGFTAAALASLSLGIGANAAMFHLLDAIGLRTLPIERPHELAEVRIAGGNGGFGLNQDANSQLTHPLLEQIRSQQQAFSATFAWGTAPMMLGRGTEARVVRLLWVSGELFPVLGVRPGLGRLFTAADDRRGCGAASVVISDDFWRSAFGGSPSAIGARLPILDQSIEIIGVTPPDFFGLAVGRRFDIALPLCTAAMWGDSLDRRNAFWLSVMGRLKPDWTLARAAAHLDALSAGLFEATMPQGYDAAGLTRYRTFRLTALSAARGVSDWRTNYEPALWWLLGMTGMVLLIACANISNLMLARANARGRELAVRVALGATYGRLVSQTLVEGLVLAVAGGAIGAVLAGVMSRALVATLTTEGNRLELSLALDWHLLAFTALVALVTCAGCALVPALRASQVQPLPALQAAGRGATRHRRAGAQRVLVAGQVALSLVLLVGALLFVRSFRNLTTVNSGLREDGIAFVHLGTIATPRPGVEQILAFERTLLTQVRSIPGVHSAAVTTSFPLNGSSWTQGLLVPSADGVLRRSAKFTYVSPGYFSTFEIPVLRGRDFEDADTSHSRKVVIVNETFVHRYANREIPLGMSVRTAAEPGYPEAIYEVVGVVADTKYSDLREETPPIAYVPVTQHPHLRPYPGMAVRAELAPQELLAEIKRRVNDLSPDVLLEFTVFSAQMRERVVRERTLAWLAGGLGVLATLMSTIGLYGVISYLTVRRRREIAIRRALGAGRSTVVSLILSEVALTLGVAIPLGVATAVAAVRGARGLLFGLSPHDPQTLIAAVALLAVVAVVASMIPALRATRIDPTEALRSE